MCTNEHSYRLNSTMSLNEGYAENYLIGITNGLEAQIANLRGSNENLMRSYSSVVAQCDSLTSERERFVAEITEKKGVLEIASKTIKELEAKEETYLRKIKELRAALSALDSEKRITTAAAAKSRQDLANAASRAKICADQRDAALGEIRSLNAMLASAKESLAETHDPACELADIREYLRVEHGAAEIEGGKTLDVLKKHIADARAQMQARSSETPGECDKLRAQILGLQKIIRLNMEALTAGSKRRRPLT